MAAIYKSTNTPFVCQPGLRAPFGKAAPVVKEQGQMFERGRQAMDPRLNLSHACPIKKGAATDLVLGSWCGDRFSVGEWFDGWRITSKVYSSEFQETIMQMPTFESQKE